MINGYIASLALFTYSNCLKCRKNHGKKKKDKNSIQIFAHKYELCNGDISKFCLMIRKGVYPYEYTANWKNFNETILPKKKIFTII